VQPSDSSPARRSSAPRRQTRAAALVALAAACAGAPAPRPAGSPYAALVDEFFAARWAFSPSSATRIGLHDYDDQLEDRSRARIEARIAELRGFATRFAALDRARLSFDERIDLQALEGSTRSELLQLETLRGWERNPMSYASLPGGALDGIMKRDYAPGPVRLRAVIARLRRVPDVYAAARANLRDPAREFTDVAMRMTRGSVRFFERTVPSWAAEVAPGDAALAAELAAANAAALAAVKDFATWLETDLSPRSTGPYAIGAETFAALLRAQDLVTTPLDEVLAAGERQLEKDHAAFVATAKLIDAKKTPAEVFAMLADDHPAEDDLIPAAQRTLEDIRRFIVDRGIITIPSEVRPRVAETPVYSRGAGFASMDTPGPFEDKATEAYYYITPVEKEWDASHRRDHIRRFNRFALALINIHEAFPGHYVQFLYAPRFPTKVRKLIGSGTNAEGWAHYTEQMMVDEGYGGGDPRLRLAQLAEALVRDCRYVIGIKLHTRGMSVEEGARSCFVDKAFQTPATAYEEARRGTFNPTYLVYTLGKLQILELRDELRAARGWSLRQFHDAFVAQGALPIPLVRQLLLEREAR
jgi:uncharacterized protein (DUF885 family)